MTDDPQATRRNVLTAIGCSAAGLSMIGVAPAGANQHNQYEASKRPGGSYDASAASRNKYTWFYADDAECTNRDDEATVSCRGWTVSISGTMIVPDPCHNADLRTIEYDSDSAVLRVVIGAESTGGFCTQCLAEIDYRLITIVGDENPEIVVVYHEVGDQREQITAVPCDQPGIGFTIR